MSRNKIFGSLAILLIAVSVTILWFQHRPANRQKTTSLPQPLKVVIFSIVEIEPIAQLRRGFKQSFVSAQLTDRRPIVFEEYNAQGDAGLVNQIADKIVTEKPDLVYALGTPVAQAIQKRAPEILIVQGAVTDPVAAGLAKSWNASGRRYIATSDLPPVPKQIALIEELTPTVRRLGTIYNPGEANSVAVVTRLRDFLRSKDGWILVERPVANTSEVATAVQSLLGRTDAVYLPPDNTVYAAIPLIGRIAKENRLPFYATATTALKDGALAVLALDFTQLGKESAELALEAINGQNPATIPITLNANPEITVSKSSAERFGIDLSGKSKHKIAD